jgi:hypothetical protein
MNLGTQLKRFHDFLISTQVVIIHQSLAPKLIYQAFLQSLDKKIQPHDAAKCAAHSRAKRAPTTSAERLESARWPTRRPTTAQRGPDRGKPTRWRTCKTTPRTICESTRRLVHCSRRARQCEKDPVLYPSYHGQVLGRPCARRCDGAAMGPLPRATGSSPIAQGGRRSPTGRHAASGSSWASQDAAGWLLHDDRHPAMAASLFW